MIRSTVWCDADGSVRRFAVRGHAEAGDPGYDIVCAAVSVLVTNTINSAEALLGVLIADDEQVQPGEVDCHIPSLQGTQDEKLQLLIQSMIYGIQQITELYPDFVRLSKKRTSEGGGTK